MATCIKKGKNKAGTVFALVQNDDATFKVLKLCSNYDGNARRGVSKTWRYVDNKSGGSRMEYESANELYIKRVSGGQK